jgi:1H-pyrrole-2-carbonyl-[peptidyl-carrier protein] brominase
MKKDVVIVGGGPSGAAAAMFLIREGIQPLIVEREQFPRYHIGESMTGEAGGVLRQLGFEERMLKDRHPIKHGVKVYGTNGKNDWFLPVMMRDSNHELKDQFTWQVRRSDFDQMLLDEAVARGASLIHGKAVKPLLNDDGSVHGVQARIDGALQDIEAEVVLDCSGQATFLANAGVTGPKYLGAYDKQIAFFSQMEGFVRDDGESREMQPGNTLIFYQKKYHWAWAIPLDDDVVSIGVVCPAAYYQEKNESKLDFLTRELRELNPELARRAPELKLVEDVHVVPNYSFQVRGFAGKGYICVGDSHRFVDPIFSFGLYVALKEAQFAAPAVLAYLEGEGRDATNPFADYQVHCEKGIDVLEDVLDGFWENPLTFAFLVYHRYRELMIDVFAGRIYDNQPSEAVSSFRKILGRERTYDADDYSIPIGSRYHPERAPLWEPNAIVDSTEEWMGPR